MFYVYILISYKDKRTYVGYTNKLAERLQRHNSGVVKSTKHRTPIYMFLAEKYNTKGEAKKKNYGGKVELGEGI